MSTEITDFKNPSKLLELEVRGFVVLNFDLHGKFGLPLVGA